MGPRGAGAARTSSNVIAGGKLTRPRARLEQLDAERVCLRITDRCWVTPKERARKSPRPLDVALQSEPDRAAHAIRQRYATFLLDKR